MQYQKRLLETVVGIVSGSPDVAITQGTLQLAATKITGTLIHQDLVNHANHKGSAVSVGVFLGKSQGSTGFGVEGAVNVGKGYSNSNSVVQNNTEINSKTLFGIKRCSGGYRPFRTRH